jgi:hypothetical protein
MTTDTAPDTTRLGYQFVLYRGEIVAYVRAAGLQLSAELNARPEDDPYRRMAWRMAQYALAACRDQLGFPYTDEDARMFARKILIPRELQERTLSNPSQTAIQIGVPIHELLDKSTWFTPGEVGRENASPSLALALSPGEAAAPRGRKRRFRPLIFNRH